MKIRASDRVVKGVPRDYPRFELTLGPTEELTLYGILQYEPALGRHVARQQHPVSMSRSQLEACGLTHPDPFPAYSLVFIILEGSREEAHRDLPHQAEV